MVQIIPVAEEFEKALLVGILSDTSLIPRVSSKIEEADFFKPAHKEIFKVITSIDINTVDSLTVQDRLSEGTKEYFIDLVKNTEDILPSLTNILVYASTIKDKSKLRAGIELGREITALCMEPNAPASETLQNLEGMFADFLQRRVLEGSHESTKQSFTEFMKTLGDNLDEAGIVTGFVGIDMILHRLEGMVILAARPSVGKTALAINIARHVAETRPVLFFSLEQTQESIFERMLAAEAEINGEEIRTGAFLSDDDIIDRIDAASKRLAPIFNNLHIDENAAASANYITSVSREKKFERGDIGLIIVDYLHIMKLNEGNKVDVLGDAVKDLRALGKELGCPVLLLSQLSRQPDTFTDQDRSKRHRRPELTDLRSSGEIEQSADIVMFLHRESYYDSFGAPPIEDITEVLIRKNRNGPIGIGTLSWVPRYTKFKDI